MSSLRARPNLTWLVILVLAAASIAPTLMHRVEQRRLRACQENLKAIATACEIDSIIPGRYPYRLEQILAEYFETVVKIPNCPAAGKDTYSLGFQSASNPDAFSICCTQHNHAALGVPPNYPQYCNVSGLIER
jgi:hypothetical protein